MTALLDAAPAAPATASPPRRRTGLLLAVLLAGAVALLAVAVLRAAPGTVSFGPVTPTFTGTAPLVTLPDYGPQGTYVLGYEHGATTRMSLPISNTGPLPVTVTSVDLGGGLAPLLAVREVRGLPLAIDAGETGTVEVTVELANCRFFHEREVQNYTALDVGFSVLGRHGGRPVNFDRPILVHSPMIIGCPDRTLDRNDDARSDLDPGSRL